MTQEIRDFNYRERMRSRREAEQGPRVALEPDPNVPPSSAAGPRGRKPLTASLLFCFSFARAAFFRIWSKKRIEQVDLWTDDPVFRIIHQCALCSEFAFRKAFLAASVQEFLKAL